MNESIIELNDLKNIVTEQARIALVNYDASKTNHDHLKQLTEIVAEQSRQVTVLVATVGDLLDAMARSREFR